MQTGKIRYAGFSDAPAWKVAQAQTIAQFRGWAPLIALQIEYNLMERTVEGELIPAALELGLGVTPWSPLKGGLLSGKYRRDNAGDVTVSRAWNAANLGEKAYDLVDRLIAIAAELESTPARVALAWLQARPGVASTIIGARRLDQLQDNVAALEVQLTPAQMQNLNDASKPVLGFPMAFLERAAMFSSSGLTINGKTHPVNPLLPSGDVKFY